MFDKHTKFRYFHNILKEVYKIIEINWEIKDTDLPKLLDIIQSHLEKYNSKQGMIRISSHYEDGRLEIFLSEYVSGRGAKKLFQDVVQIKSIIRERIIDELLKDDPDIEDYED